MIAGPALSQRSAPGSVDPLPGPRAAPVAPPPATAAPLTEAPRATPPSAPATAAPTPPPATPPPAPATVAPPLAATTPPAPTQSAEPAEAQPAPKAEAKRRIKRSRYARDWRWRGPFYSLHPRFWFPRHRRDVSRWHRRHRHGFPFGR